jgi:DNA-binding XRE family transcriptional regulator
VKKARKQKFEAAGFRIGDAADFLDLDEHDRLYLEIRRSLGRLLRRMREETRASQTTFGQAIHMDQSTISRTEKADARVSFELILNALIASGATRDDIARAIRDSAA